MDQQTIQCRQNQQFCDEENNLTRLIAEHWGIATALANEYRNIPKLEFADVLQQARISLFKAAQKYDESRGASFSTYAWRVIQNDLNTLYARQQRYALREMISLDSLVSEEENGERSQDLLKDEKQDVIEEIELREEQEVIQKALAKLPQRQQNVIRGLLADRDYRAIGRDLGFSEISAKTLVSRAYQRSLKNLKKELEKYMKR